MEMYDCTKIILERINKFDPDNANKIIGYLLLKCAHEELMQYALSTDKQLFNIATEVKAILSSSPSLNIPTQMSSENPPRFMPVHPTLSRSFSSPSSFRVPAWQPPLNDFLGMGQMHPDSLSLDEHLRSVKSFNPDFLNNCNYSDAQLAGALGSMGSLRSPNGIPDLPSKPCHYFFNGFCRHGAGCKFSHGQGMHDNLPNMYNMGMNELLNDEQDFYPGSLEKLDAEISEILKLRSGVPVSIATLPMLYYEKYGKPLQCDGYLTESQRNGKSGYSLTKLLARLPNIRLVDKPHGQHSVMLAEDALRCMEQRYEKIDAGALLPCSHQIYLTFPAESTFTDEDVMNYFTQYGPVRDVRIPRQEKRMFGFVSFQHPESVKLILGMSQPHNICGSRVLVKPYKEKTRVNDRKYPLYTLNFEPDFNTVPRALENARLLNLQLMEERERAFEMERMRLLKLQLAAAEYRAPQHYTSFGLENLKLSDDRYDTIPANGNNLSDDKPKMTDNNYSDKESGAIELPDSPFAYPQVGNTEI